MSTENGTPVVEPFDFSQDTWQADVDHLDKSQRSLFLKALGLEFPDLRWNDGLGLLNFIPIRNYIDSGLFNRNRLTHGDKLYGLPLATQAQVTLFISEYLDKVAKFEGGTVPSLHVPGANPSGSKYHREIRDIKGRLCHVKQSGEFVPAVIDVYCVLDAFDVRKPAMQHANKKTLCAGIRGKGNMLQDMKEARDALTRQIDELENGDVNA